MWHKTIDLWMLLFLLGLLVLGVWYLYWDNNLASIPATVQASPSNFNTSFHFPIFPIYLQDDPRWKDDKMGGSEETLGQAGCFVSCVSMALFHYGIDLPPKHLNELLKSYDGYTQQGWVKWDTVSEITDHQIALQAPNHPRFAEIDAALRADEPILAKILLYDRIYHWVLIVGKVGPDYWVKDPLGEGRTLDRLSQFKSKIYAIRIVKKISGVR